MSIKVMTQVWDRCEQKAEPLLVMLALADWCDDSGQCFPAIPALAEKARITERAAFNIINRLESDGEIEIEAGRGRGNKSVYSLPRYVAKPEPGARKPERDTGNPDAVKPEPDAVKPEPDAVKPEPDASHMEEPSGTVIEPSFVIAGRSANDAPVESGAKTSKPVVKSAARTGAGKVAQADIQAMVNTMALARGYPPANYARHVKAAKRLILAGRTPADVEQTVAYIRRECRNMDGQPVTMETVSKYIGLACPPSRVQSAGDAPRALPDWVVDGAAA